MNRIKELRKKKGLSQKELSALLFVNQTAVSQWERGVTTPNSNLLVRLSDLFGVSIDYLLGKDEPTFQERTKVTDEDIKFALFHGEEGISDEAYEEVKQFAAFIKQKYKNK